MKKSLSILLLVAFLIIGYAISSIIGTDKTDENTERGRVLDIVESSEEGGVFGRGFQLLRVQLLTGELKGEEVFIDNQLSDNPAFSIKAKQGDLVVLYVDRRGDLTFHLSDFVRDRYVFYLFAGFILLLLLIGRGSGLKSFVTLSITAFIVIRFMVPQILDGRSPIAISTVSAAIITVTTFFIVPGINAKSVSAVIGTLIGVIAAGSLAYLTGFAANLTGMSSEEAIMLMHIPQRVDFDFRGLLFSGIIIGALGAVMDVAMSISSAMHEMKSLKPDIEQKRLIRSGMTIGRDVMGTMTNTLILAYAGSSLSLLILFMAYQTSIVRILNTDLIATEVIRALSGSIGIIVTIPATALIAGTLLKTGKSFRER